jgi:hypothetical protein
MQPAITYRTGARAQQHATEAMRIDREQGQCIHRIGPGAAGLTTRRLRAHCR